MGFQSDFDETSSPFFRLVLSALDHYALNISQFNFIQQNSGVTYRLESTANERYLLKLHLSVIGESSSPHHIVNSRMQWLSDMNFKMGLPVQVPVKNQQNQWVTRIQDNSSAELISCTVQKWVEGNPPRGDFTLQQLSGLGRLMSQLHKYSSELLNAETAIPLYTPSQLDTNLKILHRSVDWGVLSEPEFTQIEGVSGTILKLMIELGNDPHYWGPVHSDIHHDNVLFDQNDIRIIDFDGMISAPYIYDLGVTLYHIWYQGLAARQAFLEGYQRGYPLPKLDTDWVRTCVAWAAIDNLAFQLTIPKQRNNPLTKKNLLQLVHEFCTNISQD